MKLSRYEQDKVSKIYSFPKAYISYRKPKKMSEEQREQARERMQKINSVYTTLQVFNKKCRMKHFGV